MDSIRVNNGVKVIEVNDAGETISLPLSDDSFIRGFFELLNDIKDKTQKISDSGSNMGEAIDSIVKLDEEIKTRTDDLIGENTCKKVFGAVLPSIDQFFEFFSLLNPFIEEHAQKRVDNMNKYSAERVGSV